MLAARLIHEGQRVEKNRNRNQRLSLWVITTHREATRQEKGTPMSKHTCTYQPDRDPEESTVVPVILVDELIHNDYGFCADPSCICHENQESIDLLNETVQAGVASPTDAGLIYRARTV